MNLDQARINMIKQQIRTVSVLDDHLLEIIAQTPRERFVPKAYANLAFADMPIPIGHNEFMLCPKEEALILQALQIQKHETVLEVGTGSGYFTALLAQLAKQVVSVDIISDFMTPAAQKLTDLGISNTTFTSGNAAMGWDTAAPYDIIVVTGSLPTLPKVFLEQLNVNGRLFAILGNAPAMEATVLTHPGKNQWHERKLFETVVRPLQGLTELKHFHF